MSNAQETYQWVHLRKPLDDGSGGYQYDRAYIPSRHAEVGKVLTVRGEPGWVVSLVTAEKVEEGRINKLHDVRMAFREMEVAGRTSFKDKSKR